MLSKVKFACLTPWSEFSDFVQKLFINFVFFKSVKILFIHRNLLIRFLGMLSHILQVYKVQQGVVLNGFRFLKKPCLMRLMKTDLQDFFVKICKYLRTTNLISQVFSDPIHSCNSRFPQFKAVYLQGPHTKNLLISRPSCIIILGQIRKFWR